MPAPPPSPGPGRPGRAVSAAEPEPQAAPRHGGSRGANRGERAAGAKAAGDSVNGSRRHPAPLRRVDETSAGGLVVDRTGPVALGALIGKQDRRGRLLWSLPKGHLEDGETAEDAAVREVAEETGITGEIIGVLGTIDFWFVADRRRIHKTVHHYLMRAVSGTLSDEDVEVTEVAWVPLHELIARLAYPDERELIGTATRLLDETA
jgi:ADP-ribose pyrophosphatase YjhB (NUDIX family)